MSEHSIRNLQNGLRNLQLWYPSDGYKPHFGLSDAIDELAALRAWRAQAEPLLRTLAELPSRIARMDGSRYCHICLFEDGNHPADCPVILAKALLAEGEASK